MLSSPRYFQYCALLAAFRAFMYIVFPTKVAKVKFDPKEWEKPAIQETAYALVGMIRLFMIFRTAVYAWGSTLANPADREILGLISFGSDIYLMYQIIRKYVLRNNLFAMVHQNPTPPAILQASLIVAAVVTMFSEYSN